MPEAVVKATVATVDGKAAAAKSGSRQSRRTETAAANRRGPEAGAAHSHSPTAETATSYCHPPAAETAASHSHPAAAEAAATATKTTTGRSSVRDQHGDRSACEQGDHRFA
jgi:hypothetical protein